MDHKKLKELQTQWYKKLKADGFEDIEDKDNNLASYASAFYLRKDGRYHHTVLENQREYYYQAEHLLTDFKFDRPRDKNIWRLHSEGRTLREIVIIMKKRRNKISKNTVMAIIKKYSKIVLERLKNGQA